MAAAGGGELPAVQCRFGGYKRCVVLAIRVVLSHVVRLVHGRVLQCVLRGHGAYAGRNDSA